MGRTLVLAVYMYITTLASNVLCKIIYLSISDVWIIVLNYIKNAYIYCNAHTSTYMNWNTCTLSPVFLICFKAFNFCGVRLVNDKHRLFTFFIFYQTEYKIPCLQILLSLFILWFNKKINILHNDLHNVTCIYLVNYWQ